LTHLKSPPLIIADPLYKYCCVKKYKISFAGHTEGYSGRIFRKEHTGYIMGKNFDDWISQFWQ